MRGIGEGDGPGVEEKADLGHLAPVAALGECGHMADAHRAFGGAAGDEFQRFGRVYGGGGVGAGDDSGHAARCRREPG